MVTFVTPSPPKPSRQSEGQTTAPPRGQADTQLLTGEKTCARVLTWAGNTVARDSSISIKIARGNLIRQSQMLPR